MQDQFKMGRELGKKHYAQINAMSERWKNRHIPAYIRGCLFVPYYITEEGDEQVMYVIQYPLGDGKVSFLPLVRGAIPESPT